MSLVIYLGLDVFSREPNFLLPSGQVPLPLQTLQETKQKGTVLLEEMTESAAQIINQYLASNREQSIQLLWPQPLAYIAALISQDTAPSELQKRWKVQAQRLVTLFRKNRKQLKLYGYIPGVKLSQTGVLLNQMSPLDASPLQRLAAAYLLNEDTELNTAYSYLIACSQEISECLLDTTSDITNALAQQKALKKNKLEKQKYAQQLGKVQQKLELQQHELVEVRKEAKAGKQLSLELSKVKEESSQTTSELLKLQKALEKELKNKEKQDRHFESIEEENVLIIKELHRAQEKLEMLIVREYDQVNGLRTMVHWLRAHAYRHVSAAYRNSRKYKKSLPVQVALIENSPYFNTQWYCEQYLDVAKSGMNPAEHYLKFGALEGRNPSDAFNTEYYLSQHKDVAASGQHPLLHYVKYGISEQRETQPSTRYYQATQQKNPNFEEHAE